MKIIAMAAFALALSAFGARAQTTDKNPTNPAAPSSSSNANGEDKGTAGISNSQSGSKQPRLDLTRARALFDCEDALMGQANDDRELP